MTDPHTKNFLTPKDIQQLLGVGRDTAYEIIHKLPHIRIGNRYRINREALDKWIREQERRTKIG